MRSHVLATYLTVFIATTITAFGRTAYAWGERGHDVATRAAVWLVVEQQGRGGPLSSALTARLNTLSHLSNVPDIVWRRGDPGMVERNGPTHFINLERFADETVLGVVPHAFAAAAKRTKARGYDLRTSVGTVPWRIEQLTGLLVQALRTAVAQRKQGELTDEVFSHVIMYAGILSHFVADLAQPHHATIHYDGWESGQGGLHWYWESHVINEMPPDLAVRVFERGQKIEAPVGPGARPWAFDDAMALAHDSLGCLHRLNAIDKRAALLKPSRVKPVRVSAQRRPSHETAGAFEGFAIERLALAARALANYWMRAWDQAGKPDLRGAKLTAYPLVPAFIEPW